MVMCSCNLRLERLKQEDQTFKVIWLYSKFKANLGYIRPFQKERKKQKGGVQKGRSEKVGEKQP